jgi:hypothetical protein
MSRLLGLNILYYMTYSYPACALRTCNSILVGRSMLVGYIGTFAIGTFAILLAFSSTVISMLSLLCADNDVEKMALSTGLLHDEEKLIDRLKKGEGLEGKCASSAERGAMQHHVVVVRSFSALFRQSQVGHTSLHLYRQPHTHETYLTFAQT